MPEMLLRISFEELCQSERINQELIIEVVEYGISKPVEGNNQEDWLFDNNGVHWLKKAIGLYNELEIDWVAVAMIIELLKQKEQLTIENDQLHRRLKRFYINEA